MLCYSILQSSTYNREMKGAPCNRRRTHSACCCRQRRQSGLESGGSLIRVNKISFFSGNLKKAFDFSRQIFEKFRFLGAISQRISISRQKTVIYSYFWASYSISLQKSPLPNIPPVHDKI